MNVALSKKLADVSSNGGDLHDVQSRGYWERHGGVLQLRKYQAEGCQTQPTNLPNLTKQGEKPC
ncbi:MAG: hypothetical protein AAF558_14940 [Verrucomicrobiota bacterium]